MRSEEETAATAEEATRPVYRSANPRGEEEWKLETLIVFRLRREDKPTCHIEALKKRTRWRTTQVPVSDRSPGVFLLHFLRLCTVPGGRDIFTTIFFNEDSHITGLLIQL